MSQPTQGRGGRRSRIVIDVEKVNAEAQQRRRGKGRGRRILSVAALVALGVVLLVLVGGYAWWQSYKKGPAYSLALLVDAAQRDDLQAVESLVDSDAVAQGFVPQVIEKLTTGQAVQLTPQARASVTAALPQLLPRVRETMREEIANGVKAVAEQGGGRRWPFVLLALGVPRATEITEEGDNATVKLNAGENRPIELLMRRSGDLWKVVNVKDDELANGIAARLASSIPAQQPTPQTQPRRRGGR